MAKLAGARKDLLIELIGRSCLLSILNSFSSVVASHF